VPRKQWSGFGQTFPNDEARRNHFLDILRTRLREPTFKQIKGFPLGSDEDILALSDPPYYTACPNPFVRDFIDRYGKSYDLSIPYNRKPFAADVSEGKNDPIYTAHAYHTKVPIRQSCGTSSITRNQVTLCWMVSVGRA